MYGERIYTIYNVSLCSCLGYTLTNSFTGKGPLMLHPTLSHLQVKEEIWYSMTENERVHYIEMVLESNVSELQNARNFDEIPIVRLILNQIFSLSDKLVSTDVEMSQFK